MKRFKNPRRTRLTCGLSLTLIFLILGCKVAPLQIVPQPRTVASAPTEAPKIPPPDPAAAQVPAGYKVDVVLAGLAYPSSIEFDSAGNMYVAEAGYIYGDESAPCRILRVNPSGEVEVVAEQLSAPITDLLWHENKLYVSHRGKVSVFENNSLRDIVTELPSLGDHFNNQLAVGPDGKIYIGQGTASNSGVVGVDNFAFGWLGKYPEFHDLSPNPLELRDLKFTSLNPLKLSTEQEALTARTGPFQPFGAANGGQVAATLKANGTILRFNPNGSQVEVYAWGLRNPYGLAWSADGQFFVADHGYDERGSRPIANAPDVLWQIKQGAWYGFPDFAAGVPVTQPQFKPEKAAAPEFLLKNHPPVEQPFLTLAPHGGVTQMDFSRSSGFGFEGDLFLGQVGDMQPITGNDARPVGYQVLRINRGTGRAEVFFRTRQDKLGPNYLEYVTTPGPKRPVDVRFSPDGNALYVVDIGAIMIYPSPTPSPRAWPGSGVIWRISREGVPSSFPAGMTLGPGTIQFAAAKPEAKGAAPGAVVESQTGKAQSPDAEQVLQRWKSRPLEIAKRLIAKYGQPQEFTSQQLVWHYNGPWKRTVLFNQEIPHHFPKPHADMLQQTVEYHVPLEKVRDLVEFDGSLLVDRTRGELSARCDSEEANVLALNLAHEITTGRRDVKNARQHCAEAILQKKHSQYKDALLFFLPVSNQADTDQAVPLR